MRRSLPFICALLLLAGCATTPPTPPGPRAAFVPPALPADVFMSHRALLTVYGRQFTLNGYLAMSSTGGKRLVVMEGFGTVMADVLVTRDGSIVVMKPSRAFRESWIRKFIAGDLEAIFGNKPDADGAVANAGPGHFIVTRRAYTLDLRIVETKPGPQSPDLFDASRAVRP